MKNKKIFTFAFCTALIFIFSCNGTNNDNNSKPPSTTDQLTIANGCYDENDTCAKNENCENYGCQDKIVSCHTIPEDTFNSMTARYDSIYEHGSLQTPHIVSKNGIDSLLSGLDCRNGSHVQFNVDDSTKRITLSQVRNPAVGKYSIAFFNGVIRKHCRTGNEINFKFYRAVASSASNDITLAMQIVVDGTTVYFGDLVGLYP